MHHLFIEQDLCFSFPARVDLSILPPDLTWRSSPETGRSSPTCRPAVTDSVDGATGAPSA